MDIRRKLIQLFFNGFFTLVILLSVGCGGFESAKREWIIPNDINNSERVTLVGEVSHFAPLFTFAHHSSFGGTSLKYRYEFSFRDKKHILKGINIYMFRVNGDKIYVIGYPSYYLDGVQVLVIEDTSDIKNILLSQVPDQLRYANMEGICLNVETPYSDSRKHKFVESEYGVSLKRVADLKED